MWPKKIAQKPSFNPRNERRKMKSAAPIDIPGTNSGKAAISTTAPGRRSFGIARPTAVATTMQTSAASTASTRLARNGRLHFVSAASAA